MILWEPSEPDKVPSRLLKGLREALEAHPTAVLDEYPLPKGAPGGKILEDEPAA
ncbi:MAG: hypothetical protein ACE5JM_15320 [Armatimonadota bacterium]